MPLESMPPMAPTTMTSVGTFVPRPSRSGFSTLSMTPTKMAHARNGIAVDGAGQVYVVGMFTGVADLDPFAGVYLLDSGPGTGMFWLKLTQ